MKILQVSKLYAPWIGGVETVVRQIAEWLTDTEKFSVDVLCCQPRGTAATETINGITVYKAGALGMALGMPLSISFFLLFKKLFAQYDAILLHHPFPLGFIAYRMFGENKPLYVWYHSDIIRQKVAGFLFRPGIHSVLRRAKKIFVSSPHLIDSSAILKRYAAKTVVVPFGIDMAHFTETAEIEQRASEIREKYDTPLVLSVGRLNYYKGFEYLIEAAKTVEARFLIIGEGIMKQKLLKQIAAAGLNEKVFILPHADDLAPYYRACELFVLPSVHKSEAFGVVILETMARGKPVVSTRLGTGTDWINQDGVTGLVAEPKNSKDLAEKISAILGNADLRKRLGENALARAKEFTKERFVQKLAQELTDDK